MWASDLERSYELDSNDFEAFLYRISEINSGITISREFNMKNLGNDIQINVAKASEVLGLYIDDLIDRDSLNLSGRLRDIVINRMKTREEELSASQKEEVEREEKKRARNKAISEMLISSGFSFDGYRIVKYSGYISGDDATQIPRSGFKNNNAQNLTDALVKIRIQALKELKEAAYDLGCNAVIGVDFDYLTLEPESAAAGTTYLEPYVICVTANGNAVIVEKEE